MTAEGETAVVEQRVAARPETVFSFFTSAERWLAWQGTQADIEPRPGGIFRVNVRGDGFVSGTFLELVPARRIVFTWGWEGEDPPFPVPPGGSRVEIDLEPDGPDGEATLLRLRHAVDLPALQELVMQGWAHYLERLAAVSEGRDPGPDPNVGQAPDER